jgi:hypothetical protein
MTPKFNEVRIVLTPPEMYLISRKYDPPYP